MRAEHHQIDVEPLGGRDDRFWSRAALEDGNARRYPPGCCLRWNQASQMRFQFRASALVERGLRRNLGHGRRTEDMNGAELDASTARL